MAQLTDDCFAFSGPLLRLEEMERLILERISPVPETERVRLHGARGRVVAADVKAPVDLPPFDNSAVDGYAVRHADLAADADTKLTIVGRLMAGARAGLALDRGHAIRIFTGAAMPRGADTVFMQEDVTVEGSHVIVPKGLKLGSNRRLAGEDVRMGAVVLPAGTVLQAQHIALLAALGITEVAVRRRLKVAIFSTGDEVVEPGTPRAGAAIYDANRYLLAELLERLGAAVTDLGILADDADRLAAALREAATGHDLIITSGGVSTGEADYVRTAVERAGSLVFWRVAIKPGRPFVFGRRDQKLLFGLPGNPVSALVTFLMLVRPALLRWQGARQTALPAHPGVLAEPLKNDGPRRHFMRVKVDPAGRVSSAGAQASHVLSSLAAANGLVDVPPQTALPQGAAIQVLRWDRD